MSHDALWIFRTRTGRVENLPGKCTVGLKTYNVLQSTVQEFNLERSDDHVTDACFPKMKSSTNFHFSLLLTFNAVPLTVFVRTPGTMDWKVFLLPGELRQYSKYMHL